MDNTYTQKVINANVFHNYFLDAKKLYLHYFNELPGLDDITGIDAERAFAAFTAISSGGRSSVKQTVCCPGRWITKCWTGGNS